MRAVGPNGLALILAWEKIEYVGYLPTPNDVPTAGAGHTGPDVIVGQTYTDDQVRAWLAQDIGWVQGVLDNSVVALGEMTQNQYDACASLIFNIGASAWMHSSVLRDLDMTPTNPAAAADAFLMWDKQHGTVLQGLLIRREQERDLFLTPDDAPWTCPSH